MMLKSPWWLRWQIRHLCLQIRLEKIKLGSVLLVALFPLQIAVANLKEKKKPWKVRYEFLKGMTLKSVSEL